MGKHFFYKSEGAAPVEDTSNEALPGGGERARWYGTGETRYKVLLTVNGNACPEFYVPFLNGSPTPDPVVVPLNQEPIRRMARRYNGMYELMFVMSLKDTDIAGDARWRTVCNLEFNGNKHYLGPLLFSDPPAESAMLVEEVPSKLTLYFAIETRVPVGEKAASYLELLLAAHVADILAANPYGGSMAFSHLRNDVSWLPFLLTARSASQNGRNSFCTYLGTTTCGAPFITHPRRLSGTASTIRSRTGSCESCQSDTRPCAWKETWHAMSSAVMPIENSGKRFAS
ncbi:hypothetical protein ERJ75_001126800 [Trypanosoma vivax]|nr:hypothetical protein ERJ75_001126800 [Trypanosoma vivax]